MRTRWPFQLLRLMTLASMAGAGCLAIAQQAGSGAEPPSANALGEAVRDLREQVGELQKAVAEMRAENEQVRTESAELRREVERLRASTPAATATPGKVEATTNADPTAAMKDQSEEPQNPAEKSAHENGLEEEYDLLAGKIDDQYQTKVESASKYRMRISGMVLLNLFSNRGSFDSVDVPTLATGKTPGYPNGSFGGTLRQSEIGFEVFGPRVGGARARADLQLDFGGGFEPSPNGASAGLVRLRTGTFRLDWQNTSVVAGQDNLFFSPGAPTSFASLVVPALTYAGNLWGWIPQVRVEHRLSLGEESNLTFQGGILDPLSGEMPGPWSYRLAGPGEASRQPAFGSRVGWTHSLFGQPMRFGVGGFYSRQSYGFDRYLDAWAGMTDFEVPLTHRFSLSGKVYRGDGLGGLYGGIARSVLFSGDPGRSTSLVRGLNTVGGWAQLKYQATSKVEFNTAFGLDNPFAKDLKAFPGAQAYGNPTLARNSGGFANVIFRPRSDLVFSAEYRHLKTYTIDYGPNSGDHVNLMMGVLF
jgi:regulator of replication initiation timing